MPTRPKFKVLPRHVAIIMDGNGRWARRRTRPRIYGHRAGITSIREVVRAAAAIGVQALTLYAFSKENWRRPRQEVGMLMRLLAEYLRRERRELMENGIVLRSIGDVGDLPAEPRRLLRQVSAETAANRGMVLTLALSYSGRDELRRAFNRLLAKQRRGELGKRLIEERDIAAHLDDPSLPEPDLLIRTSGEMRMSNFLLWQLAYTEIYVTDVLWPDFRRRHFFRAIREFGARERRFGGVK